MWFTCSADFDHYVVRWHLNEDEKSLSSNIWLKIASKMDFKLIWRTVLDMIGQTGCQCVHQT